MTTPDTTDAVRNRQAAIEAMQTEERRVAGLLGGVPIHPLQRYEFLYDAVIAELDRLGFEIVKRGAVPSWMQPWGFLKDGGGYIFDGVPTADGFVCNANLEKNEMRLYRLASHTPKTELRLRALNAKILEGETS